MHRCNDFACHGTAPYTIAMTGQVTWNSDAPNVLGVDVSGKGIGKTPAVAHATAT